MGDRPESGHVVHHLVSGSGTHVQMRQTVQKTSSVGSLCPKGLVGVKLAPFAMNATYAVELMPLHSA